MQNFKKYGVAIAVASVATGAVAANGVKVSSRDMGDAAIVPYYNATGGKITGLHVVNTTDSTQAVKVRLRRGADSADAMDFNVVMSPHDEWTAYVGHDADGNLGIGTSDNTCTVPKSLGVNGWATMPTTYAEGAEEGYVEIIAMAETTNEKQPIAKHAKHADGEPADCAMVEKNFLRVPASALATAFPARLANKGVNAINITSNGACTAAQIADTTAPYTTACSSATVAYGTNAGGTGAAVSYWQDSADNALKVSYFIREGAGDTEGGMEAGMNAVHLEGFSDAYAGSNAGTAMLTNQVVLVFDKNDKNRLVWDPLNFEFPNLGQALGNTTGAHATALNMPSGYVNGNKNHFNAVRAALDVSTVVNEWADNANASVDWVVTLPGQYAMTDGICTRYGTEEVGMPCAAVTAAGAGTTLNTDDDQLPIYLVKNSVSKLSIYDREELPLTVEGDEVDEGIQFSPSSTDTVALTSEYLKREVNVLVWGADDGGVLGSAAKQSEDLGLMQVVSTGELTEGWASLGIEPLNSAPTAMQQGNTSTAVGAKIKVAQGLSTAPVAGTSTGATQNAYLTTMTTDANYTGEALWNCGDTSTSGGCTDASYSSPQTTVNHFDVPVVGAAFWKREFAGNAASNYGRAIEHSVVGSGDYASL